MKSHKRILTVTLALALATTALAGVPQLIPYQGYLIDAGGDPVADGPHLVKFIIYDAPAGGSELWNSGFNAVTTTNGLFAYDLGSNSALPDNLFTDTARYLGITYNTDPEMTPRVKLNTMAYAYHALRADSLGSLGPGDVALSSHNHDGTYSSNTHDHTGVYSDVGHGHPADITAVNAGTGLTGGGTSGSVTLNSDLNVVQARVTGSGTSTQAIRAINSDGTVVVSNIPQGDITAVNAGNGLNGGGTSGSVSLTVDPTDFNGSNPALESRDAVEIVGDADVTLTSASITTPGSGRVVALGTAVAECNGCVSDATAYMTISTSSTGSASIGDFAFRDMSPNQYATFVVMTTYAVGAGTHTYYLRARRSGTGGGTSIDFFRGTIQLIFIPN